MDEFKACFKKLLFKGGSSIALDDRAPYSVDTPLDKTNAKVEALEHQIQELTERLTELERPKKRRKVNKQII